MMIRFVSYIVLPDGERGTQEREAIDGKNPVLGDF